MSQMLTAKEIQTILEVDRSTVYRMAEDGRLPAIKVGRQWRFPAHKIEDWLSNQQYTLPSAGTQLQTETAVSQFPLECVQMMQDTFAEALGVMLIITNMAGQPITRFSNSCGLFAAIGDNDVLWGRCMSHWQEMADSLSLQPQYVESYLGLLCTRAFVRVGTELKGMVFVGGIAPDNWPLPQERLHTIAADLGVDAQLVFAHLQDVFFLSPKEKAHVLTLVQKIANVVSHILHERHQLMAQ
jgi:excisionase family DNA binding protein